MREPRHQIEKHRMNLLFWTISFIIWPAGLIVAYLVEDRKQGASAGGRQVSG
jgi:hypothetical protein